MSWTQIFYLLVLHFQWTLFSYIDSIRYWLNSLSFWCLLRLIDTWHFYSQFYIAREHRGNEGTCIGVSKWPITEYNHRTTVDMWLYRAYSGNLYHGGEQTTTLPSYTQGDVITCVLDMDSHTLSFGKNGEVCVILIVTTDQISSIVNCTCSLHIIVYRNQE